MAMHTLDLWSLVRGRPQLDPHDLADAVVNQAAEDEMDYRTRLLIRDSVDALKGYWGDKKVADWLAHAPYSEKIRMICLGQFERIGFPTIARRLMDKTDPETIRQFLEHLGQSLHKHLRVYIAGSVALILPGYVSRHTDDVDIIDEVPIEIRNNHQLVDALQTSYGLELGHVQSHYFPSGWLDRAHSMAPFGNLEVFLLDVYDVFLSKLFSSRLKDMEDMRVVAPQLEKDVLIEKLKRHAQAFLSAPRLLQIAQSNWKILYGEELPQ
jgi:Nucleotidyltransferase of unknown function (DUF6036)